MERKYKILKILYYVIRVHRFEYYFVVFVCVLRLMLHKVALYVRAEFLVSVHFFFFVLRCLQLRSLHHFLSSEIVCSFAVALG